MSHIAITYHFVFCTYLRKKVINIEHERELYKFIYEFSEKRGIKIRRIGEMPDHVHILCDVPPKMSVSEYAKLIKAESSKFLHVNNNFPYWEKWAEGYAAVSVEASLRQVRVEYIKNQKQHHARQSFETEYTEFLKEYGFGVDTPLLGDEK